MHQAFTPKTQIAPASPIFGNGTVTTRRLLGSPAGARYRVFVGHILLIVVALVCHPVNQSTIRQGTEDTPTGEEIEQASEIFFLTFPL